MEVASLFVSLGVKGSDKAVGAFANVNKGIQNVASSSLEAKAAILAAIYALDKLFTSAAAKGTALANFAAYTGLDAEKLQRWQYAAQQAGISNDEFTSSLKAMNNVVAQMKISRTYPIGTNVIQQTVGLDLQRAFNDKLYLLNQLKKFANTGVDVDVQNQILKGFGISDNVIAAMRRGVFNPANLANAPVIKTADAEKLSKIDASLKNRMQSVQMMFSKLAVEHGSGFMKGINEIVGAIEKLILAFDKLSSHSAFFDNIAKVADLTAKAILKVAEATDFLTKNIPSGKHLSHEEFIEQNKKFVEQQKMIKEGMINFGKKIWDFFPPLFPNQDSSNRAFDFFPKNSPSIFDNMMKSLAEPKIQVPLANPNNNNNVTVNQSLNFQHEGKEAGMIADSTRQSVLYATQQLYSKNQVT